MLTLPQAFLPTVFLVLGTPTISGVLMKAAEKLNSMENYATVDGMCSLNFSTMT